MRWGPPSMSAFAQRALIGVGTPDPPITGDAFLRPWQKHSGGQNLSGLPFLPPGHWALCVQNLVDKCVEITPPTLAKLG